MTRFSRCVAIGSMLLAVACGDGGIGDESASSGESGEHEDSGAAGRCDVYDGKDEYLACVCEEIKPCIGISPQECPQVIRGALKYGQHDGGLACTQALGNLFECEFALTCQQYDTLIGYWSECAYTDPSGLAQPFCRRETLALAETCDAFQSPCDQG